MLDRNAAYLGRLGENVTDVGELWSFAVMQAEGLSVIGHLSTARDAAAPAPGPQLTFDRMYHESLSKRYTTGTLGRGWSTVWQESLELQSDGTVVITSDGGDEHLFQPDSRHPGTYFSEADDLSTLVADAGGKYRLTDHSGNVTGFRADGKLDYVQDTNGNKITAGYSAGRLTSLTHSSGASLTITYNAAGLIDTVTDSLGRQAVYTYDANNQYLTSVRTAAGTTRYTYSVGGGAASEHALTSIENPDGTHRYFTFDAQGRLGSIFGDDATQTVTCSYDQPGEVTVTDADGVSTKTYFDHRGLVAKSEDGLGNATILSYDPQTLRVTSITNAAGRRQSFSYDAEGNLTGSTDPLGHKTLFTYGAFNRLASFTDANGNKTAYGYDLAGNPLSTTSADGSVQRTGFDPLGQPVSFINRRGQAVGYAYNAAGQVTRQTFPDSTQADFTYDPHGNLKTATDASGVITFAYDQADRLTRVDYPGGRFLEFTLDAGGRRTKMVDQDNFAVNSAYDAAGRLSGLTDGGNSPIVTYIYDDAGRIARKDNGNGTYTTYQYDADGNVLHLINYAPGGGTVNSRFDYTYDNLGRVAAEATSDGQWTYSYDALGELTHAVFASNNPASIPNQDLQYAYDAVGNRTSTVINGVTATYTANNLNQYTAVGRAQSQRI